jgi:hypothetical protein
LRFAWKTIGGLAVLGLVRMQTCLKKSYETFMLRNTSKKRKLVNAIEDC